MKNILKLTIVSLFFFLIGTNVTLAACTCNNMANSLSQADCTSAIGIAAGCSWKEGTGNSSGAANVDLKNPLGDINSVPKLIGQIIKVALGIVDSLALVMFVYGGFT